MRRKLLFLTCRGCCLQVSWLLFASVIYVPIFQKSLEAIAEFEVVFLMFNIGLELSVERLSSMKKYVFGLGSAQVLVTTVVVGLVSCFIAGQPSPAAIIIGNGLASSSTAVVLQVGFQAIAEPLGLAAVKAIVAITAIIAGGRLVESDIAPYRGLLLGLFFMMVGMSIDPKLFVSNFPVIMGTLPLLIGGKTILVAVAGRLFGISIISAIRVGLLLAPGGEFAFVAFGEAVNQLIGRKYLKVDTQDSRGTGQKKNYLCGFGIGPQPSSTFDAAAQARDQQMDAMRAEMEALHEERQRDHEELMMDREEGKSDHEEMMREREELMKQAEDGKKAQEAQVQLNHLNNMVSRLTSLLQP